jgi:hypothetical protein
VSASGDDGNVAANVLDGSLDTRWSSSGDGQYLQFCLDALTTVTGADIAFYQGNTRVATFDMQTSVDGSAWVNAATGLKSSGTSTALESFSFSPVSAKYVRIVGHGNSVNAWNSITEVRIKKAPAVSDKISVINAYPNPFSQQMTIQFTLQDAGQTSLIVYATDGHPVRVLANEILHAGQYTRTLNGGQLAAGVYLLKLVHNGKMINKKIVKN